MSTKIMMTLQEQKMTLQKNLAKDNLATTKNDHAKKNLTKNNLATTKNYLAKKPCKK